MSSNTIICFFVPSVCSFVCVCVSVCVNKNANSKRKNKKKGIANSTQVPRNTKYNTKTIKTIKTKQKTGVCSQYFRDFSRLNIAKSGKNEGLFFSYDKRLKPYVFFSAQNMVMRFEMIELANGVDIKFEHSESYHKDTKHLIMNRVNLGTHMNHRCIFITDCQQTFVIMSDNSGFKGIPKPKEGVQF